jgi:protein SCO1
VNLQEPMQSKKQAPSRDSEVEAATKPASSNIQRLLVVLIAIACIGVTTLLVLNVFWTRSNGNDQNPLRAGTSGPTLFERTLDLRAYELINQDNQPYGSKELEGKVYIASFVFTRCMQTCPVVLRKTEILRDEIEKQFTFKHVRLVSISLDPEYDTPQRLMDVAKLRGAKPDQWVFLTGEKNKVVDLIRDGFKTPIVDNKKNKAMPIEHNSNYVLVDRSGKIRGYYDALKPAMQDQLMHDIAKLIQSP